MKVENLFNPDTGNDVANQFRIYTGKGVIFQSYETTICIKENGKVFLNEDKETIDNKIASGEYILTDLNK